MKLLFKRSLMCSAMLSFGLTVSSTSVYAQQGQKNAPTAPVGPVICPGYERGKTNLPGQSVGKKVGAALDAYNEDNIPEAVKILEGIKTDDEFDGAFVKRFLGNILAGQEGEGERALKYLIEAAEPKKLNDSEHASLLKLIGDLSMQESKLDSAVKYYNKWMKFTCKEDADVYTRIANAYYQSEDYAKIVEPADKAIGLYEKPNKNPYVLKLQSFYERKMWPEAVQVAEALVETFPDEPRWWSQLGSFYLQSEDYDRALSAFEIAYNAGYLTKKSELQTLSQLYGAKGIPHKSAEILNKYIESGLIERDKDMLSRLANAYHQARDYKTAAKVYGEAAKLSSDPDLYQKQGTLLLVAEQYKDAIQAFKLALENGSDDKAQIHYALMEANFYRGDYKQAYVHVQEAKKDKRVRRNANAWVPYIETKAKNKGIKL